jgi:hypothetical protein
MKFYGLTRKKRATNYALYWVERIRFNVKWYALDIALLVSVAALFVFLIFMNVLYLRG